jgi:hypothetical protein
MNIIFRYMVAFEIDKLASRYQRNSTFFTSDSFLYMVFELAFSALMPYPFLVGKLNFIFRCSFHDRSQMVPKIN